VLFGQKRRQNLPKKAENGTFLKNTLGIWHFFALWVIFWPFFGVN
jgi:hypothetical protein